jgi:hypothetical protein
VHGDTQRRLPSVETMFVGSPARTPQQLMLEASEVYMEVSAKNSAHFDERQSSNLIPNNEAKENDKTLCQQSTTSH